MQRKYMFLCGCPRSGTTALHELVSHSPWVACGIERYYLRLLKDDALRKEHFEKQRFFQSAETDTHYGDPRESIFQAFYRDLFDRYDDAIWFGDKIPGLYRRYESIQREFGRPKILFIYRNAFDVCLSYKQRFLAPEDDWRASAHTGVTDWNTSLFTTLKAVESGVDLLGISYEALFTHRSQSEVQRVFDFLELPVPDGIMDSDVMRRGRNSDGKPEEVVPLSEDEKLFISMNAKTAVLRRLHDHFATA